MLNGFPFGQRLKNQSRENVALFHSIFKFACHQNDDDDNDDDKRREKTFRLNGTTKSQPARPTSYQSEIIKTRMLRKETRALDSLYSRLRDVPQNLTTQKTTSLESETNVLLFVSLSLSSLRWLGQVLGAVTLSKTKRIYRGAIIEQI